MNTSIMNILKPNQEQHRHLWLPIVISVSILIRLILAVLVPAISGSHLLPENKYDTVVASDDGHSLRGASISSNKVDLSSKKS